LPGRSAHRVLRRRGRRAPRAQRPHPDPLAEHRLAALLQPLRRARARLAAARARRRAAGRELESATAHRLERAEGMASARWRVRRACGDRLAARRLQARVAAGLLRPSRRGRGVLVQTSVVVLAAALIEMSRIGGWFERALLFVLGPVAAAIVHLVLSPKREFEADRFAARICESPHGLADALIRLEQASELVEFRANPATEPLYTFNPFAEEGLAALFVTHPPVGERVRRLRELDPDWR